MQQTLNNVITHTDSRLDRLEKRRVKLCLKQAEVAAEIKEVEIIRDALELIRNESAAHTSARAKTPGEKKALSMLSDAWMRGIFPSAAQGELIAAGLFMSLGDIEEQFHFLDGFNREKSK